MSSVYFGCKNTKIFGVSANSDVVLRIFLQKSCRFFAAKMPKYWKNGQKYGKTYWKNGFDCLVVVFVFGFCFKEIGVVAQMARFINDLLVGRDEVIIA